MKIVALAATLFVLGCSSASKQTAPDSGNATGSANAASTTQAASAVTGATSFVSYENAVATARSQNKVVFVDIYTDWCTWCKKLDNDVYSDPRVKAAFAKDFTTTKINAESDNKHTYRGAITSERDLSSGWNVSAYPTLVFLDQNEKPILASAGYMPADEFLKLLQFVSSGDYKKNGGDFKSWLSSHSS